MKGQNEKSEAQKPTHKIGIGEAVLYLLDQQHYRKGEKMKKQQIAFLAFVLLSLPSVFAGDNTEGLEQTTPRAGSSAVMPARLEDTSSLQQQTYRVFCPGHPPLNIRPENRYRLDNMHWCSGCRRIPLANAPGTNKTAA